MRRPFTVPDGADTGRITVAEKLKSEGRAEMAREEAIEEIEDQDGNTYNRKVSPSLHLSLLPLILRARRTTTSSAK